MALEPEPATRTMSMSKGTQLSVPQAGHFCRMPFELNGRAPIVFSPHYDFNLGALKRSYPFDFTKRGRAFNRTRELLRLEVAQTFAPDPVSDSALELVHPRSYLESLRCPRRAATTMQIEELEGRSETFIEERLLTPLRYATGGTMLAVSLARQYGWAFNFSGGFHHAMESEASGFCFLADTAVAIRHAWQEDPRLHVVVVDLDAHHLNGVASILGHDPRVSLFDIYNHEIYPIKREDLRPYYAPPLGELTPKDPAEFTRFFFPIASGITDEQYLALLSAQLPVALDQMPTEFPRLVIAHLGQDPFEGDRLGRMRISAAALRERDEIVFRLAREREIPIAVLLAGGYSTQAAEMIATSLTNVVKCFTDH